MSLSAHDRERFLAAAGIERSQLEHSDAHRLRTAIERLYHWALDEHWVEVARCRHRVRECCDAGSYTLRSVDGVCDACRAAQQSDWVRLVQRNSWGHPFYTLPWEGLDAMGTIDVTKKLDLPSTLRVRWPDGTEGDARIVEHRYRGVVCDMGREERIDVTIPMVQVECRGATSIISVGDVEVYLPSLLDRQGKSQ